MHTTGTAASTMPERLDSWHQWVRWGLKGASPGLKSSLEGKGTHTEMIVRTDVYWDCLPDVCKDSHQVLVQGILAPKFQSAHWLAN